jgi:hypothetical protein
MPQDKQKVIRHTSIIVVIAAATILIGSSCSYSTAFALSLQQPAIHHHNKVFDKKQQDRDSSDSSEAKISDRSNNEGNSDNNFDENNKRGTNDGSSDSGSHDNLQAVEPENTKSGKQQKQQGTGKSIAPGVTATPTPTSQTTCERGSNCTDQQGLSDHDRVTTNTTTKQDDNTPFVLSLPFP